MLIGIDLGTSAVKALLVDKNGVIIKEASCSYPISFPQPNYSEQNPIDWFNGVKQVIKELGEHNIKGISFSGQMHGLVTLDKSDQVIRPAILWNDGRSVEEVDYLNNVIGKEKLSSLTGNIAFAGFTSPKIMWMKNHEPSNYQKISKVMLPKDYIAYMMSSVHATDYSDASGMLLLDVKNKCWSDEMCDITGCKKEWLPKLYNSWDEIGTIKKELAKELNIDEDCKIIIGGGDNAVAAIGTNTIANGTCNISLGTSGTIFICSDKFIVDDNNSLHAFCHASGKWHLMGCILSAASCNKWWLEEILHTTDYDKELQNNLPLGDNKVIFLPYLTGERSPHNDVFAKGCFIGLTNQTTRSDMNVAIMEGVAFALRDCLEIARSNGLVINKANLCGGGAKSPLWQEILANILKLTITVADNEQGPAYGASVLAMQGVKYYKDATDAFKHFPIKAKEILPHQETMDKYDKLYQIYNSLYPTLKQTFKTLG